VHAGDIVAGTKSPPVSVIDEVDFQCKRARRGQHEKGSGDCYSVSSSSTSRHVSSSYFRFESEIPSATASRAGVVDLDDDNSSATSVPATTSMIAEDLSILAPTPSSLGTTHQQRMLPFNVAALLPTVGFMMEQVNISANDLVSVLSGTMLKACIVFCV